MAKKQSTGSNKEISTNGEEEKEIIVQYIIVRNDLGRTTGHDKTFNALLKHTTSASTAAIHKFYKHEDTEAYLKDLDSMKKKVFQVDDEEELFDFENKLILHKIDYKMWIKQPDNYATCIATRPYPISEIAEYFKNLKIYKR